MQIRYFPTRCDAGGTQRTHHCDAASRTAARDGLRNGISSVQPTRRSINRQPPNPCSTHASPICMTISPSAIAECKRILAIHIYRSTALPPALARPPVRPSVQSVRFQQRPLPSAFCSTSILSCAHARPLSFSLSLSLSLSLLVIVSRVSAFLRLRFVPLFPLYVPLPLHGRLARSRAISVALVGVVGKARWVHHR